MTDALFFVAVPTPQAEHDDAPILVEKNPGAQGLHSKLPSVSAKYPAAHGVHVATPDILDAVPVGQGEQKVDEIVLKWPGGHFEQSDAPGVDE